MEIKVYDLGYCNNEELTRVICVSKYQDKYVFSYNKKRKGWEIPGGHIEENETWQEAARREMYEETGATKIKVDPVCIYKISTFGLLCYCEILELGKLPEKSEMTEICFSKTLPDNLTFPEAFELYFDVVTNNRGQYKSIPDTKFLEIYENKDFISSPLVELPSDIGILVDMQYPKLGMECAINKCLVRKELVDMLIEAKKYLPEDITFKIWDAYRPLSLQTELFYKYKDIIIKEFHLENLSEDERNDVIKNYVSLPKEDEEIPPLHATGGAIDLTLTNVKTGEDLDMGIAFDAFSDFTNTVAYEKEGMDEEVRKNRRMLYNAMTSAGFTNLPSEVWHYDYGDRAWAFYNNKPAIYKGILEYKETN